MERLEPTVQAIRRPTSATSQSDESTSVSQQYNTQTVKGRVANPPIVKLLGLYPHLTDMTRGRFYMAIWTSACRAVRVPGIPALTPGCSLDLLARSFSGSDLGFLPALTI